MNEKMRCSWEGLQWLDELWMRRNEARRSRDQESTVDGQKIDEKDGTLGDREEPMNEEERLG